MTIKIMHETLSNKIAAGEVVERPRSIVKELVENALDAQATHIKISLEDAGIKQIIVEDNGIGMNEEDALKSFLRHATSKIFSEDDLFRIATLGFRGEALAAIASVSRVHLHTGMADVPSTHIVMEAGIMNEKRTDNARIGTMILVDKLFYNTPARLKHLKSLHTENMHVTEYLQKMALARSDVRFEYVSDLGGSFKTYGTGQIPETLAMIYGDKVIGSFFDFSASDHDFSVSGVISHPKLQRSNSRVLHIAINYRTVRSFEIHRAIIAGYGNLIPKGMFPIVVLNIEVDPTLVDVNVHPAKLEVRLSQERQLEDLIQKAIKTLLQQQNLLFTPAALPKQLKTSEQLDLSLLQPSQAHKEKTTPPLIQASSEVTSIPRKAKEDTFHYPNQKPVAPITTLSKPQQQVTQKIMDDIVTYDGNNVVTISDTLAESVSEYSAGRKTNSTTVLSESQRILRQIAVIGQYDATYIIAQHQEELYLIDQHAAQERIKYDEHMRKANETKMIMQDLLMPYIIHLEGEQLICVQKHHELIARVGIDFEFFGEQDIRINSVATLIPSERIEHYVRKAIDCVIENQGVDNAQLLEQKLIMLSCKYSIKAHDVLSRSEMETLLHQLSELDMPFTCPHGRPIVIKFTKNEIERWFKRA